MVCLGWLRHAQIKVSTVLVLEQIKSQHRETRFVCHHSHETTIKSATNKPNLNTRETLTREAHVINQFQEQICTTEEGGETTGSDRSEKSTLQENHQISHERSKPCEIRDKPKQNQKKKAHPFRGTKYRAPRRPAPRSTSPPAAAAAANRSRTQLERSPLVNTASTSLGLGLVGDEISAVHSSDSTRGSAYRASLVSPEPAGSPG